MVTLIYWLFHFLYKSITIIFRNLYDTKSPSRQIFQNFWMSYPSLKHTIVLAIQAFTSILQEKCNKDFTFKPLKKLSYFHRALTKLLTLFTTSTEIKFLSYAWFRIIKIHMLNLILTFEIHRSLVHESRTV